MVLRLNPVTGDLDLTGSGSGGTVTSTFNTDSGTATASGGAITIAGGTGISTSGASATVTVTLDTPVSVPNGGTGTTTLTDGGVILGSGTSAVTSLGQATDGQLVIGDTGADPVLSTLTAGTGVTITNAAGSITIDAAGITALSFPTDSGTATPAANALTVAGGTGISTSGSGSTVTVTLDTPVIVANGGTGATSLTDGGVVLGSGTGAVTVLGQATNGQLVIGSTGVDPVLATLTAGTDITITEGAGSITINSTAAGGGWVEETTTSRALAINENVVMNNGSLVTGTLPTTAAFGSVIRIAGKGAGGWLVAQNADELIHFGTSTTTTGAGGSLASTEVNDAIELVCIVADTEWMVISSIGNITVV